MAIRSGMGDWKIQEGEDVDVLRSPGPNPTQRYRSLVSSKWLFCNCFFCIWLNLPNFALQCCHLSILEFSTVGNWWCPGNRGPVQSMSHTVVWECFILINNLCFYHFSAIPPLHPVGCLDGKIPVQPPPPKSIQFQSANFNFVKSKIRFFSRQKKKIIFRVRGG